PLLSAAKEAGVQNPETMPLELPSGSAIFFHGDLWHGSGRNQIATQTRRSFAVSTLPRQAQFQPLGVGTGYIFNRYRRLDSLEMHESYYPILWGENGDRTPFLEQYCSDALSV
ncbi:MAG: phytanoyl-CoA dioxygenase family protein, partial [Cyanobacteria bacterium P01_H01_bin.15]